MALLVFEEGFLIIYVILPQMWFAIVPTYFEQKQKQNSCTHSFISVFLIWSCLIYMCTYVCMYVVFRYYIFDMTNSACYDNTTAKNSVFTRQFSRSTFCICRRCIVARERNRGKYNCWYSSSLTNFPSFVINS